jgi:hypothetical protein
LVLSQSYIPFLHVILTGYTHQGWLSPNHEYFVFGDETDEKQFGFQTKTLVMNVKDLNNIFLAGSYFGKTPAIDHNLYIKDDIIYLANYRAGMRILKVNNYDSANFQEIGFFDVHPGSNTASFNGAWSVYPYFASGNVLISSIERGLFIVKPTNVAPAPVKQPTPAPTNILTATTDTQPTPAPVKQPTMAPNSGTSGSCASGKRLALFELLTDNWSYDDNHFKIIDRTSNQIILSREKGGYTKGAGNLLSDSACLPAGDYRIIVYDDWATDGLTGDSYFKFMIDGKEEWSSNKVPEVFVEESFEFSIGSTAFSDSCPNGQKAVVFELMTDSWSYDDNHFEIMDRTSNQVMLARAKGNYPKGAGILQSDSICLPAGEYTITLYDDWPTDGLTGTSYFKFFVNGVVEWTDTDIPEIFTAESFNFSIS